METLDETTKKSSTNKASNKKHKQLIRLKAALMALYVLSNQQEKRKSGMDELIEELGLEESLKPLPPEIKAKITFTPEEIAQLNAEIEYAVKQNEIAASLSIERLHFSCPPRRK